MLPHLLRIYLHFLSNTIQSSGFNVLQSSAIDEHISIKYPSSLLYRKSFSSSVSIRGASRGHVFHQTSTWVSFVKPSQGSQLRDLLHQEVPSVTLQICPWCCSFVHRLVRCKNRPFPESWRWETLVGWLVGWNLPWSSIHEINISSEMWMICALTLPTEMLPFKITSTVRLSWIYSLTKVFILPKEHL